MNYVVSVKNRKVLIATKGLLDSYFEMSRRYSSEQIAKDMITLADDFCLDHLEHEYGKFDKGGIYYV